jgi:hypothetical protein
MDESNSEMVRSSPGQPGVLDRLRISDKLMAVADSTTAMGESSSKVRSSPRKCALMRLISEQRERVKQPGDADRLRISDKLTAVTNSAMRDRRTIETELGSMVSRSFLAGCS